MDQSLAVSTCDEGRASCKVVAKRTGIDRVGVCGCSREKNWPHSMFSGESQRHKVGLREGGKNLSRGSRAAWLEQAPCVFTGYQSCDCTSVPTVYTVLRYNGLLRHQGCWRNRFWLNILGQLDTYFHILKRKKGGPGCGESGQRFGALNRTEPNSTIQVEPDESRWQRRPCGGVIIRI